MRISQTIVARVGLVIAIGSICHLIAGDLRELDSYRDIVTYPAVAAGMMEHIGAVLLAYAAGMRGGKVIGAADEADRSTVSADTVARLGRL